MNKKDLIKSLVDDGHFSTQKAAKACLNDITATIQTQLVAGNSIKLFGLGKFSTAIQKGRSGTLPGSTKTYTTQNKVVPRFKAAKTLKDAVAGK